jgi:hypothetical protein
MPDLSDTLLPRLAARSLPGLPLLPAEFVLPDYSGGSIANLPAQIASWLGAGPFGGLPLHPEVAAPLGDQARQVVVVLVDALGYRRFRDLLAVPGSAWERIQRRGVLAPLTSVFPSTTTAALTSLSTGLAPGCHGMLGYELWLKEFGVTANMITFRPFSAGRETGSLLDAGFDPETFIRAPTLVQHLLAGGIDVHAFLPATIAHSGLSRMNLGRAVRHPFYAPSDLWPGLRHFLEATPRARQFVWVYWPMVDTLSHACGPSAEPVEREASSFGDMLMRAFLDPLAREARAGTVLILMADHGQVDTPPLRDFELRRHAAFVDLLHILPTGENRAAYLHCRPGQVEAAQAYVTGHWPDDFLVLNQAAVMASGLLGAPLDDRTASRLGELLLLARGSSYLWWAAGDNLLRGRHGGLTQDEMLVPFVAARLDD